MICSRGNNAVQIRKCCPCKGTEHGTLDRSCQHRSCQDCSLSQHESCQKKACSPGQIDCTSAKKGGSFLSRAARIRSRSASTATSLRTMMTQSSRQNEILSVPARPFVLYRMVRLFSLVVFMTKAITASLAKVIFVSTTGMRQVAGRSMQML